MLPGFNASRRKKENREKEKKETASGFSFCVGARRSIKNDRTVITQNLCAVLMISHLLILTTLDRHYFHLDDVSRHRQVVVDIVE